MVQATVYTRADLVDQALTNLGIVQQAVTTAGAKSRADLINDVLFRLGAISVGTPASAEDTATVDGLVDDVFDDLKAHYSLPTTASPASIPTTWFNAISALVANALKRHYGVTGEQDKEIMADAVNGQGQLRQLVRLPTVDEHVDAVLATLASMDVVMLVDDSSIPHEWFLPISDVLADQVKTHFADFLDEAAYARLAQAAKDAIMLLRELTRSRPSYLPLQVDYL